MVFRLRRCYDCVTFGKWKGAFFVVDDREPVLGDGLPSRGCFGVFLVIADDAELTIRLQSCDLYLRDAFDAALMQLGKHLFGGDPLAL